MKITMHDVGFGDFFVLNDNNENCFIDCGSKRIKHVGKIAKNEVENYTGSNKLCGLLTHFHEDHYSGFKELAKSNNKYFDQMMIPCIVLDDIMNSPIQIELATYFYTFLNKNTLTWKLADNILNSLNELRKITKNENLKYISSGDTFSIGSEQFEVLWPDRVISFDENLKRYLFELDKATIENQDWTQAKNRIIDSFQNLRKASIEGMPIRENIVRIGNEQNRLLNELNSFRNSISSEFVDIVMNSSIKYHGTKLYSKNQNSTSIVFHHIQQAQGLTSKLLMTGDVEKSTIDEYLAPKLKQNYKVIKAPHHGTENHYSSKLPQTDNILISTRPHKRYGKISKNYRKHANIAAPRYCTNGKNQCESIDNKQPCNNRNCNNGTTILNV
jgi:beta-lactamase superfamily II metal-dependent hydrolase